MKKVFNNSELPHVWAHKRQAEGRASNQFFEGDLYFSYGWHYCVARHLPDRYVAVNLDPFSKTTSRHMMAVLYAVNHLKVIRVVDPECPPSKGRTQARVDHLLQQAAMAKPTGRRPSLLGQAKTILDDYNTFCDLLKEPKSKLPPLEADPETLAEIKRSIAHVRKQEAERRKQREAAIAESHAKQIDDWRKGLINHAPSGAATMLRVNGDKIDTSHGAHIPVADALRLWPVILRVMGGTKDYEVGMNLGGYQLTQIYKNGGIRVGCHDIPFAEIEGVAKVLRLLNVEEMA